MCNFHDDYYETDIRMKNSLNFTIKVKFNFNFKLLSSLRHIKTPTMK